MAIAHLGAVWALRGARAVPLPAVPLKREPRTVADHLVDYAHAPAATTNTNSTTGKQPLLAPYGGGTAMVKADGYVSLPSPGTVPMDFFLQQLRLLAIDRLPPVDALPGACDVLDAGVRCSPPPVIPPPVCFSFKPLARLSPSLYVAWLRIVAARSRRRLGRLTATTTPTCPSICARPCARTRESESGARR